MDELEIIRYAKIEGIRVFFNTVDYRTPHQHEEWEILWNLEGHLIVKTSKEAVEMLPGEMAVFPPFTAHEFQKAGESSTFLCIQISPRLFPGLHGLDQIAIEDFMFSRQIPDIEFSKFKDEVLDLTEVYLNQEDGYELECISKSAWILHEILRQIPYIRLTQEEMEAISQKRGRILRFQKFVDENYKYKIKLADFAAQENLALSYVSTFIKKELNQSFREYVNQIRFYASLKLMSSTNMSLQDICMECGFSDYRYFAKVFQQYTGMSPYEYRKSAQKPISGQSLHVHQSLHSLEKFYTLKDSLDMLAQAREKYGSKNKPAGQDEKSKEDDIQPEKDT